jgi:hypothetical protein
MVADAAPLCTRPVRSGSKVRAGRETLQGGWKHGSSFCGKTLQQPKPDLEHFFLTPPPAHTHNRPKPPVAPETTFPRASPVGLVYCTLPTVMLQVPGRCRGELLME